MSNCPHAFSPNGNFVVIYQFCFITRGVFTSWSMFNLFPEELIFFCGSFPYAKYCLCYGKFHLPLESKWTAARRLASEWKFHLHLNQRDSRLLTWKRV